MNTKKLLLYPFVLVVVAFSCALMLKASVGVGPWDALAQTGSQLSHIRVGTVGMFLNFFCIFLQLVILRKDFRLAHGIQIVLHLLIGYAINFFYYDVFGGLEFNSYITRLLVFIAASLLNAFAVAVIMLLDVVTFALEGACNAVALKTKFQFHHLRQAVDIVSVVLVLILSFAFRLPPTVREGTVIGMLIFAPAMGLFMKLLRPFFKKHGLTD